MRSSLLLAASPSIAAPAAADLLDLQMWKLPQDQRLSALARLRAQGWQPRGDIQERTVWEVALEHRQYRLLTALLEAYADAGVDLPPPPKAFDSWVHMATLVFSVSFSRRQIQASENLIRMLAQSGLCVVPPHDCTRTLFRWDTTFTRSLEGWIAQGAQRRLERTTAPPTVADPHSGLRL